VWSRGYSSSICFHVLYRDAFVVSGEYFNVCGRSVFSLIVTLSVKPCVGPYNLST
jgi:hypothetical protein